MTGREIARMLLSTAPLTGARMLLCATAAVVAPTLIRLSVDGAVEGVGFTPYLPFVLLAALLLDWRVAAAVAVSAAILGDFLFVGQRHQLFETGSDLFGLVAFSSASALAIGLAHAFQKAVADPIWLNGPDRAPKGIVFSQEAGQVYVSWYGGRAFVPIGAEAEVAEMMRDFLAQRELGKRLFG